MSESSKKHPFMSIPVNLEFNAKGGLPLPIISSRYPGTLTGETSSDDNVLNETRFRFLKGTLVDSAFTDSAFFADVDPVFRDSVFRGSKSNLVIDLVFLN